MRESAHSRFFCSLLPQKSALGHSIVPALAERDSQTFFAFSAVTRLRHTNCHDAAPILPNQCYLAVVESVLSFPYRLIPKALSVLALTQSSAVFRAHKR